MPVTNQQLLERLKLHEDSFVERKPEGGEYKPTLVAFANSVPEDRDAVLYIGVHNNGQVLGVANPDALQKKIQRFCSESCFPPLAYTTELLLVEEKVIVAVVISRSDQRPHFAGPAWVRTGSQNLRADPATYADLVTSRHTKAAELLKYRGKPVTLVTSKDRVGQPQYPEVRAGTILRGQLKRFEARVKDVTPFFVRFENQGVRFTEPLANVEISYDEDANRPLLMIHLDGA